MHLLRSLVACSLLACAEHLPTGASDTGSEIADTDQTAPPTAPPSAPGRAVVLTLRLAPSQPLADPVWGGLAAQPTDVQGTVRLVARARGESTGADGTMFPALPARDLGAFRFPGEASVPLEPGPHTVDVDPDTVDLAPHPGCVAGSSPLSGCAPAGWFGSGGVSPGGTADAVEVYANCECDG